mmetsp:Transcript_57421/g.95408  ORF Transcript_57421/g.95408 Transcript_57421/m.95408 type:complete len:291 (+) Transcript_57421:52-924(+)
MSATGKHSTQQPTFPTRFELQIQARVRVGNDLRSEHVTDLPEGTLVTVEQIVERRARISRPVCGWISCTSKFGGRIIQLSSNCDGCEDSIHSKIGDQTLIDVDWDHGKLTIVSHDTNKSIVDGDSEEVDDDHDDKTITVHQAAATDAAQEFLQSFVAAVRKTCEKQRRLKKAAKRANMIQAQHESKLRIKHYLDCIESRAFQDSWITQQVVDKIREYIAFHEQFYTLPKRGRKKSKLELNRLRQETKDAVNEIKTSWPWIECDDETAESGHRSIWNDITKLLKKHVSVRT